MDGACLTRFGVLRGLLLLAPSCIADSFRFAFVVAFIWRLTRGRQAASLLLRYHSLGFLDIYNIGFNSRIRKSCGIIYIYSGERALEFADIDRNVK